jgi:hypothetical protein
MDDQTLPLSTQQTDDALESWVVMVARATTVDEAMTLADLAEHFARRWQLVADEARQRADLLIEERD